jgi:hypothetical protein
MGMTEELTQRETVSGAETLAARLLEAGRRLHSATDENGLGQAAFDVFSVVVGAPPETIRVAHDGGVSRRFGADDGAEAADSLLARATHDGLPVVDGHPVRALAVPVQLAGRTVGAVYVAHPGLGNRFAGGFELLKAIAAHLGTASMALAKRETDPAEAAVGVTRAASLHDAKLAFERRLLQLRLAEARGNVAAAARALDMDRGQLSRLMRKHSLDRAAFRATRL